MELFLLLLLLLLLFFSLLLLFYRPYSSPKPTPSYNPCSLFRTVFVFFISSAFCWLPKHIVLIIHLGPCLPDRQGQTPFCSRLIFLINLLLAELAVPPAGSFATLHPTAKLTFLLKSLENAFEKYRKNKSFICKNVAGFIDVNCKFEVTRNLI